MKLVPIDSVRPSSYNPRLADPRRLDLLELSLRKLGFLLPIYADASGEILSGHQRQLVAERVGLKFIPVEYTTAMDLRKRQAINIAFNRGTNDLSQADTPENLTDALMRCDIYELAGIADLHNDQMYPCMNAVTTNISPILKENSGRWQNYARNMASMLSKAGIEMPLVCTKDLRVINGLGRLQYAAERGQKTIDVIFIEDHRAQLADAMLNLLSMDFDIHTRYRDMLRHNSFRRARRTRAELGCGFVFSVIGDKPLHTFDITRDTDRYKWIGAHGMRVVDFGAGHLTETNLLRSVGIEVAAFEPYRLGLKDEIDKTESLRVVMEFLEHISRGDGYSSVFISSVLNSVPFKEDRESIVCICAALCGPQSRLHAAASSINQTGWGEVNGKNGLSNHQSKLRTFKLDYEAGIAIGDIGDKPKVQKYHTTEEFYSLFKAFFANVNCRYIDKNVCAVAWNPLPLDVDRLRQAIEFEFDLPYPDGSRMGMVDVAKCAFSKRLGVAI
jgi:hypothetical protein